MVAAAAFGQTPAFELASIKPSDPNSVLAIRRSGHRLSTANTSLLFLITWAYDMHRGRVYGQPAWLDSAHYDIIASAPEGSLPARVPGQPSELQKMMQALLADRFKLALHRETRELPMYALVIGKGGPKFHLADPPAVFGQTPFSMPAPGRLVGTQVTAEMLCKVLSDQLGRSVQDQTGLAGVFDFTLEWQPDSADEQLKAPAGASLFTAIQEQLGLKLESRKGPVEVLVIDHIESAPTAN
jgi:uncharacterized protein (TIGR03435 family)